MTALRLGYVVKCYPRFSETFIVREILQHEAAGVPVSIFSLRSPSDTHFQSLISRVRAPVTYVRSQNISADNFWEAFESVDKVSLHLRAALSATNAEDSREIYQALLLAREIVLRKINHLHSPFTNIAASVTRLAALFAGISYSCTARAKDIFHNDADKQDLLRRFQDASAIVTISDFHLRYLQITFPEAAEKMYRVYNSLDLEQFAFSSPLKRPRKILSIGRLVEKKGFEYLIDACSILSARGIDFICEIAGSGPLKDDLKSLIHKKGLGNQVKLLGAKTENEIIPLLRSASVLALPCVVGDDGDRDGLPNVLFEAMAVGTPCVSTDVTGIPEILHHEKTGLMVPQRDSSLLADALQSLIENAALRVRLATAARALVEKEFDGVRNATKRREIFISTLRSQPIDNFSQPYVDPASRFPGLIGL